MKKLVQSLDITPNSRVLEIGFGSGYSATSIQTYRPQLHTIIECDRAVLDRASDWKGQYKHAQIQLVPGIWQHEMLHLVEYDCIFFDDFPNPEVQDLIPKSPDLKVPVSRWHDFLDLALTYNLSISGRITGYLARKLDLSRPGCSVQLTPFPVHVSSDCTYFDPDAPLTLVYIPHIQLHEKPSSDPHVEKVHRIFNHHKRSRPTTPGLKTQDRRQDQEKRIQRIIDELKQQQDLTNEQEEKETRVSSSFVSCLRDQFVSRDAYLAHLRERRARKEKSKD